MFNLNEKYHPGHSFIESIIQDALNYDDIVIDSFSGMGGFTDGFERAGFKTIGCINHWLKAIQTHAKNWPLCLHIMEDFRTASLDLLKYMVDKIRFLKPSIRVHGSFGLECTNFSNAKGGMPRDNDSRTLADHIDRYVEMFDFDVMWIENVKEFLLWGPMLPKIVWNTVVNGRSKKKAIHFNPEKHDVEVFNSMPGAHCPLHIQKKKSKVKGTGKPTITIGPWMVPDPEHKSADFKRWKEYIKSFGYDCHYKLFNAADYGVPQHRIRLIMQWVRKGIEVNWPKPTHHKKGLNGLPKWKAIGPCLELEDEGTELLSFEVAKNGELRPRIKSKKTIQRLMKGCLKHVFRGEDQFIIKYMGNNEKTGLNNGKSINEASNSIPTSNRVALASAHLIDYYFGNGYTKSEFETGGVTGTKDGASLHTLQFIGEFRTNGEASSIEDTSKAILPKDKFSLDTVQFIDMRYSSGQTDSSLNEKSMAVLANPKQILTTVDRYVMDTQFNNDCISLKDASGVITANRKHFYIINAAWFDGHSKPITEPSATLIARQDKTPQYLIVTETGELAIEIYPHDPPHYVAMKRFMADHGIVSVKMRMLFDTEMLRIQSFKPEKTQLTGSTTDNKKMIGNAVPPELIEALANAFKQGRKTPKQTELPLAA